MQPGEPGFTRKRAGRGFVYFDAMGRRISDATEVARIRALAIPPAWTDVWICRTPNGHIQATGRDARGRKQYRYHVAWRTLRDSAKYHHVVPFGLALPRIRARVARDLARPGLDRDRVAAIAVRILDEAGIRVGNDEYARLNRSFGLTTLRDRHARFTTCGVELDFVGKGGKRRHVTLHDRKLARLVRRCRDVPGQRLLQYYDGASHRRALSSGDVNRYLSPFTAKEFRTWHATVGATLLLAAADPPTSAAKGRRTVNQVLAHVADGLGNTLAVAKRCYVHPTVVDAYMSGTLRAELAEAFRSARRRRELRADEAAVLAFLEARLALPSRVAA